MRWMVASVASASGISVSSARQLTRKSWASAGREDVPFSLAIIFQVAKSARALVSARRAISMSAALIKMASGLFGVFWVGLHVAGYHKKQPEHIAGQCSQYHRNNIKI